MPTPGDIAVGALIAGRYVIESQLGRGGFGTVYAARHSATGQPVAVKVLRLSPGTNPRVLERFIREAHITAHLEHPNTVRVFDFGQTEDGAYFLVMERLRGKTLRQLLSEKVERGETFGEKEAASIAIDILRSLGEAHAERLVHRDLKPDNLILHEVAGEPPIVKLLDFGIAKLPRSDLTTAGQVPCTPEFASPEVALGESIDGRADLYSLGVCLFAMVSGTLPFRAPTPHAVLVQQATRPPPDLRELPTVRCSEAFIRIVERALAKSPADRFPDAPAMRAALESCLRGDEAAPVASASQLAARPARPDPVELVVVPVTLDDAGADTLSTAPSGGVPDTVPWAAPAPPPPVSPMTAGFAPTPQAAPASTGPGVTVLAPARWGRRAPAVLAIFLALGLIAYAALPAIRVDAPRPATSIVPEARPADVPRAVAREAPPEPVAAPGTEPADPPPSEPREASKPRRPAKRRAREDRGPAAPGGGPPPDAPAAIELAPPAAESVTDPSGAPRPTVLDIEIE